MAYRNKRGSLHLGMRMERAAGTICEMLARGRWKRQDGEPLAAADFMLHLTDEEKEGPPITMEEAMRLWR